MASYPFAQSALVSAMKACMDTFSRKVVDLATECRVAAYSSVDRIVQELDQIDPRRPELVKILSRIVEPFVEKRWQEREAILKADIKQLYHTILWKPLENIDDSPFELTLPVSQSQPHDSDAHSQASDDDTSDIIIVECWFASKISYPIRPPLHASLSACVAVDTCTSLSACLALDGIVLNNMPARYSILSMTHSSDSRYVMAVCDQDAMATAIYAVDIDTRAVDTIAKGAAVNIVTRGGVVVTFATNTAAVRLNRAITGNIDIECRNRVASGWPIHDRWCQQLFDDIYVIDSSDSLYRISWHDVIAGRYDSKCLIDDSVEDFYMHEHGNAILKTTGIIALKDGRSVNMQDVDDIAKWSAVIRSADRWIACGDRTDSRSTIASIDDAGVVISTVTLCTTDVDGEAFIKYLKTAIVRGRQAVILAIDISARCHLISMTASGRLHMLESMPSIYKPDVVYPDDTWKATTSMSETDVEGQYIVAGYMWIKKLTVELN